MIYDWGISVCGICDCLLPQWLKKIKTKHIILTGNKSKYQTTKHDVILECDLILNKNSISANAENLYPW